MNILSIGNSFSQDAQRYLHKIAEADGYNLNAFNLYIGGCSLHRHYSNMLSEKEVYTLEMNGESTNFMVSMKEALLNREWDVVTIQQVSTQSPYYETYQPYLNKLAEFIKICSPKSKIVIHQTWAYEQDSERLNNKMGYDNQSDMFVDVKNAYEKAAKEIGADLIIPSGELFQRLILAGVKKIHRDTFHASIGLGRYALGLLWYKMLTGKHVSENKFNRFDEEISETEIKIVKNCVEEVYISKRVPRIYKK